MEEKKPRTRKTTERISLDDENFGMEQVPVEVVETERAVKRFVPRNEEATDESELVNCLRNEKVIARHINRPSSITDPRHVCYGRMHENAKATFTVPILSSGTFVNVLTNDEKNFLEYALGLKKNALSVYNKENNFWDDSSENALASVTLEKQDNVFDLSKPEDYIRVKILLANKNLIAPSYEEYQDHPKASYLFYLTSETEESKVAIDSVSKKSQAYIKLGELSGNIPKMRMILELLVGRPTSPNSKEDYLKVELSKCIEGSSKEFLKICADPLLDTKSFIKQCLESKLLSKKGDWYYLRSDGSPLCEMGENPTLNVAAKFLSMPKHQEIYFSLQAKLDK